MYDNLSYRHDGDGDSLPVKSENTVQCVFCDHADDVSNMIRTTMVEGFMCESTDNCLRNIHDQYHGDGKFITPECPHCPQS